MNEVNSSYGLSSNLIFKDAHNDPFALLDQILLNDPIGKFHRQMLYSDLLFERQFDLVKRIRSPLFEKFDGNREASYMALINSPRLTYNIGSNTYLGASNAIRKTMQSLPQNNFFSYLSRQLENPGILNDFRIQSRVRDLSSMLGKDIGPRNVSQVKSLQAVTKPEFTNEFLSSIDEVMPNSGIDENVNIQNESTQLSNAANLINWEKIIKEAESYAEKGGPNNEEDITEAKNVIVPSLDLLTPRIFDYLIFLFVPIEDLYKKTKDPVEYVANVIAILEAIIAIIKLLFQV